MMSIFPGRFQPFHNGHFWVLDEILKKHGECTIAIVNPDPQNTPYSDYETFRPIYNPFNYWDRYSQIRRVLINNDLFNVVRIIPLLHPRQNIKNEISFLPEDRIWYIPALDNHEIEKIADFKRHGEIVVPLDVPSDLSRIRSTDIRNCIYLDIKCCECYPREIYDMLWSEHSRFLIKDMYLKHPVDAKKVLSRGECSRLKQKKGDRMKVNYDWIRAFGEAAFQLGGPLTAPLKFALSLYQDEKDNERNQAIEELVRESKEINLESLGSIFELRKDIQRNREVLLGFTSSILSVVKQHGLKSDSLLNLTEEHKVQILSHWSHKLESKEVIKELRQVFSDDNLEHLKAIARESGFPIESINWNRASRVVISNFVDRCQWQDLQVLSDLFKALNEEYPGSGVIAKLKALFDESKLARDVIS